MLSRASLLSGQQCRALVALATRATSTTSAANLAASASSEPSEVTFKRPVRVEPGKVRLGFIPDEWFTFFYKKTGVTGPYTFAVALSTYLVSKEIYVLEHEYYTGLSLVIMCVYGVKKMGPLLAKYLDKEIDDYQNEWNEGRDHQSRTLSEQIEGEKKCQWSSEGQVLLVQAKRENVALQLESAYRQRLYNVYEQVKKRLDYQIEQENVHRRLAQKNLVNWVLQKVTASITPDQEKQNINKCIADLAVLAKQ